MASFTQDSNLNGEERLAPHPPPVVSRPSKPRATNSRQTENSNQPTPPLTVPPTNREGSPAAPPRTTHAATPFPPHSVEKARGASRARAILNPCWLISALVQMIMLLIFALLTLPSLSVQDDDVALLVSTAEPSELLDEVVYELDKALEEPSDVEEAIEPSEVLMSDPVESLADSQFDISAQEVADLTTSELNLASSFAGEFGQSELGQMITRGQKRGAAVKFFGTKVEGNFAVVFDVTKSMYGSVDLVLREIDANFKHAQIVAVHGATFKKYGKGARLVPYRQNTGVHEYQLVSARHKNAPAGSLAMLKQVHGRLLTVEHCYSLPAEGFLQSLGTALEALLNQPSGRPKVIFVFSDFADGIDVKYMQAIQQLANDRQIKIVICNPEAVFARGDRDVYAAFARATGGELKLGLER